MTTDKQRAARARNWRIFQLRNLYGNIGSLALNAPPSIQRDVRKWIDEELGRINAEPEGIRQAANWEELRTERGTERHIYIATGTWLYNR